MTANGHQHSAAFDAYADCFPVVLYYWKHFTSGHLAGLTIPAMLRFVTADSAAAWARVHASKPIKCVGHAGTYTVVDPTFQATAR